MQQVVVWLLIVVVTPRLMGASVSARYCTHTNFVSSYGDCQQTHTDCLCPSPWQYCDVDGKCQCGQMETWTGLQCKVGENLTLSNSLYCLTMNCKENATGYSTYLGNCLYQDLYFKDEDEIVLPDTPEDLNESVCGRYFNRTGILCGACKEDHYPLVYSFDMNCVKCSNRAFNFLKFAMAAFLPLTIFYFVVVLFHINVSSSYLNGYVLCCQGITMPSFARAILIHTLDQKKLQHAVRIVGSLLSIWNLDIFRYLKLSICLETDSLQTLALDLVIGVYPLFLIILSYLLIHLYDGNFKPLVIAWKPFKAFLNLFHKTWEVKTSLIDAFATFFLLTNMKFLNICFDMLIPTVVYQLDASGNLTHSWRLYYDTTVPFFGKRHLPYAILAISVFIVFVITPVLLLSLYPFRWFQKLLNLLPFRMYVLHTFMDTFHGCFKVRTEPGTRDCRWFASVFFFLRLSAIVVGAITLSLTFFPLSSMLLVLVVLILITAQPYKPNLAHYSSVNATFLLLLTVWYMSLAGHEIARVLRAYHMAYLFFVFAALVSVFIMFYASAVILQWMWRQRKFGAVVMERLQAWRHGYEELK